MNNDSQVTFLKRRAASGFPPIRGSTQRLFHHALCSRGRQGIVSGRCCFWFRRISGEGCIRPCERRPRGPGAASRIEGWGSRSTQTWLRLAAAHSTRAATANGIRENSEHSQDCRCAGSPIDYVACSSTGRTSSGDAPNKTRKPAQPELRGFFCAD